MSNFIMSDRVKCNDCKTTFSGGRVTYELVHGVSHAKCPNCKGENIAECADEQ